MFCSRHLQHLAASCILVGMLTGCSDAVPGRPTSDGGGGSAVTAGGGGQGEDVVGPDFRRATRVEIPAPHLARFGLSLDLDGATLAAGARSSTDASAWGVFVYVRSQDAWAQQAELTPLDGGRYGATVSLDGDLLAVAAPNEPPASGYAYIYVRRGSSWDYDSTQVDNGISTTQFATSVAVHGNGIVVGAAGSLAKNGTPGLACFNAYRTDGVLPTPSCFGDISPGLGCSAAMHGETALVGVCGGLHGASGGAHLFARAADDWAYSGPIVNSEVGAAFGRAVALEGDTALVADAGVVFVYERLNGQWSPAGELRPGEGGVDFGFSVAVSGGRVVVGDPEADGGAGAAFVFAKSETGWVQQAKLLPGDASGHFGYAVSLDGPVAAVSAVNDTRSTITVFTAPSAAP